MANKILLKRSSTASNVPTAGELDEGELAINTNPADRKLYSKDSGGTVFEIGGNVSNTGTPLNNQVAIWTDATTIEGVNALTFDGTTLAMPDFQVSAAQTSLLRCGIDNTAGSGTRQTDLHISAQAGEDFYFGINAAAGAGVYLDNRTTGNTRIEFSGTTYAEFSTANLSMKGGADLRVYDNTNADYVDFSHGGVNFNITGFNTSNIDIIDVTDAVRIRDGAELHVYDSTDTDFIKIWHNGTNAFIDASTSSSQLNLRVNGSENAVVAVANGGTYLYHNNIQKMYTYGSGVAIPSGNALQILDSTNTDNATFSHDGTDFVTTFTNTTEWNIDGAALNIEKLQYQAGTRSTIDEAQYFTYYWPDSALNNNVWYKVCDVTLTSGTYRALAQRVRVVSTGSNYGSSSDFRTQEYVVHYHRSGAVADNPNDAEVIGYDDIAQIRVYKTATGTYELQLLVTDTYEGIAVEVFTHGTNGGTCTPTEGLVAGTTAGGTAYTAGVSTGSTSPKFWLPRTQVPQLVVTDTTAADYATFSHDGTDFNVAYTNTAYANYTGLTSGYSWTVNGTEKMLLGQNYLNIKGDADLRIYDATDTDTAIFNHDGTDFNTTFAGTTDWNISGAGFHVNTNTNTNLFRVSRIGGNDQALSIGVDDAGLYMYYTQDETDTTAHVWYNRIVSSNTGARSWAIQNNTATVFSVAMDEAVVRAHDGYALRIQDSTDTDYAAFSHDGTNFNTSFTNTSSWNISLPTTGINFQDAGQNVFRIDNANNRIEIRDAWPLRIHDATDTDYADFSHDGTDFNTSFFSTTDWNITNLAGGVKFADSVNLKFGTGSDFLLYHDGTNNYIDSVGATAELRIRANSTESSIICKPNGVVELYTDNQKSLETSGQGIIVQSNNSYSADITMRQSTGVDLFKIQGNTVTPSCAIVSTQNSAYMQINGYNASTQLRTMMTLDPDDFVRIYHPGSNVQVFETDPEGVSIYEGALKLEERASAAADTNTFGQVWVYNSTPNQLWFTHDLGTDVQITEGSYLKNQVRTHVKTADESVTSSTTYQDDNHFVSIPLDANRWYRVEFHFDTNGAGGGLKFQWVFSNTLQDTGSMWGEWWTWLSAGSGANHFGGTFTSPITGITLSNSANNVVNGVGHFRTNATTGGTLKLQWAQQTSNATASTLGAGSHMTIQKLN